MRIHKRDSVSFCSDRAGPTAYDIASTIRILSGQKLSIMYEQTELAWYNNCTEVENDKENPALRRTVDFVGWLGPQMCIYVGGGYEP